MDIKVLYSLYGKKSDDLADLAREELPKKETQLYFSLLSKVNAYQRSYNVAKIDVRKFDSKSLLPAELYRAYENERQRLLRLLLEAISANDSYSQVLQYYNYFYSFIKVLTDIRRPIQVSSDYLHDNLKQYVSNNQITLHFNPVGAKTGRMTCEKNTFNIFSLSKDQRRAIEARPNYKLVQFDYKSFQPRIAIALTEDEDLINKTIDAQDIYMLFKGDRQENKINFIKWMFSPSYENDQFSEVAGSILDLIDEVYREAKSGKVVNKFGRPLFFDKEEKNVVFQNYITSTEADMIFKMCVKIHNLIKNSKSRLLFPFHDCLVFEISEDEMFLTDQIKNIMENYYRNKYLNFWFPVKVSQGSNFGEMK